MSKMLALLACTLCLGIAGGSALAQKLQKYRTPDGKIVYSDRPVPGAHLVDEVAPPPPPDPEATAAARAATAREGKAVDEAAGKRAGKVPSGSAENDAAAALERAKQTLERGREPLPGERLGTVSGKSRLSEEYFARQRTNEAAVAEAQARLDKARSGR
ncbi:MAG: DUF4124 domain-containing protein [Burkholderiales bacterium]|nr:DUF4124 domain-containing protein [Burkholderiales bacterium]